jgi:circadian clock protein KaiC
VRELILSDYGVTLADVYTAGGDVLMGTRRREKENAVELERQRLWENIERKRRELELAEMECLPASKGSSIIATISSREQE